MLQDTQPGQLLHYGRPTLLAGRRTAVLQLAAVASSPLQPEHLLQVLLQLLSLLLALAP